MLMSAAPGSTHFQAGLLQPDFSRLGVRISWAFSCCGPRNSPCCIQPPASSLPPPVSSRALNRPVPHCLFATSWHPAAPGTVPFCPAIQRGTCSQWGAVGQPGCPVPSVMPMADAAAVRSKPSGSSGGSSTAIACFPQARDSALPLPSSGDPRALAGLCTCQSTTEVSQSRLGSLPHCDRGWLAGAGSRKGTLDGSHDSSPGQRHLPALTGCCGSGAGCVWCPWVLGKGSGCSHRVLPPGSVLPSSSPDTASCLPLLPEVPP